MPTEKPIDDLFGNQSSAVSFTAKQGESAAVNWSIRIPVIYTSGIGQSICESR